MTYTDDYHQAVTIDAATICLDASESWGGASESWGGATRSWEGAVDWGQQYFFIFS